MWEQRARNMQLPHAAVSRLHTQDKMLFCTLEGYKPGNKDVSNS